MHANTAQAQNKIYHLDRAGDDPSFKAKTVPVPHDVGYCKQDQAVAYLNKSLDQIELTLGHISEGQDLCVQMLESTGKTLEDLRKAQEETSGVLNWVKGKLETPPPKSDGTELAKRRLSLYEHLLTGTTSVFSSRWTHIVVGALVLRYGGPEVGAVVRALLGIG